MEILLLILLIYLFISTINYKIMTVSYPPTDDEDRKVIMSLSLIPLVGPVFALWLGASKLAPKAWPAIKRLLLKIKNTGGEE